MTIDRHGITRRDLLKGAAAGAAVGLTGLPDAVQAAGDPDLVVDLRRSRRGDAQGDRGAGRDVALRPERAAGRPQAQHVLRERPRPRVEHASAAWCATVAQICMEAGAEQVMVLDNPLQTAELCLRRAGVAGRVQGPQGRLCPDVHGPQVLPRGQGPAGEGAGPRRGHQGSAGQPGADLPSPGQVPLEHRHQHGHQGADGPDLGPLELPQPVQHQPGAGRSGHGAPAASSPSWMPRAR